jgi:hypothetical protein
MVSIDELTFLEIRLVVLKPDQVQENDPLPSPRDVSARLLGHRRVAACRHKVDVPDVADGARRSLH